MHCANLSKEWKQGRQAWNAYEEVTELPVTKQAAFDSSHVYHQGEVLPEKLGGGVRPASQNPYPIYDQTLRNSLPFL